MDIVPLFELFVKNKITMLDVFLASLKVLVAGFIISIPVITLYLIKKQIDWWYAKKIEE